MTRQFPNTAVLEHLLGEARASYRANNPKSLEQHQKAARVLPGGNTRTVLFSDPFPITLSSAEGCRVTSLDGRTYVDFLGEFTAGLYGHSDPVLRQAVLEALNSGWVRGGHIQQEEALANLICERFPSIAQVRFANSGTEANLYAISVARAVSKKSKVMVFEGAYHGGVFVFGAARSPLTAPFDFVRAPYNDWEAVHALLEANQKDLACVIIEPMQGSGGCIPAEPAFLRALRAWTQENGVILIFDEVMTSRLNGGGLQGVLDIAPDMTTLGKYIGAGFSFGAFGGRADIMARFNPLLPGYIAHAGTFNNNVFTMSAGAVGLAQIFTPQTAVALTQRGDRLRSELNEIANTAVFPMQFTGIGSMMNVHMCEGPVRSIRDLVRSCQMLRDLFYFDMLDQGIWAARRGMFNLSLPMGEVETQQLIDAVSHFVRRLRV
ncbi:aminotransferase class III-fold pyridoxal phosphate-dependent enzyme [Ottowia sp. GY511]|uniref:Aspartate aminotransferase family protein n=1 Tax=Ottowia flava TaxID=2675430 RepID=A0ABW4L012_9BURK|nr:aminotransferase class III-fold pyridoxal phosphate-dependent enzyme [Ottowia sp. GY511]TXK31461.1 aminotransferase class III-fold pyridoxal phosphate-dependent enzyme [Ottowia sp. GY511]